MSLNLGGSFDQIMMLQRRSLKHLHLHILQATDLVLLIQHRANALACSLQVAGTLVKTLQCQGSVPHFSSL